MSRTVGIAGAGLIGRMTALALHHEGWSVTLFDRDQQAGTNSCSYVGAGMLTPLAELEKAEPLITEMGLWSLEAWAALIDRLPEPVFFERHGSLVVAHQQDQRELEAFRTQVQRKNTTSARLHELDRRGLAELEPELAPRFARALFLEPEGQLEPRMLLPALAKALQAADVTWHHATPVTSVAPGVLETDNARFDFDLVLDCRGLGARSDWADLRGVRGEIVRLHAPEVRLSRPVRLMHPRYPIYITPRPQGQVLIGATQIESDDMGAVTVRSALELLSAAYSLHPGFAEARILETRVHCRPALPDNNPALRDETGLLRVNGCYRHGFLIAPALVAAVTAFAAGRAAPYPALFHPSSSTAHQGR